MDVPEFSLDIEAIKESKKPEPGITCDRFIDVLADVVQTPRSMSPLYAKTRELMGALLTSISKIRRKYATGRNQRQDLLGWSR